MLRPLLLFGLPAVVASQHDGWSAIVNDFDSAGVTSSRWSEGWYTPCSDSYGDHQPVDFHHDMAGANGLVTASYSPVLPGGGCYEVFEWHPGKNPGCARYLPKDALITVHPRDGAPVEVTVDQSVNGGAWNSIGRFEFEPHQAQYVVASNRGGDLSCDTGNCFWIADAVRFVYTGEVCQAAAGSSQPQPAAYSQSLQSAQQSVAQVCHGFHAELRSALQSCEGVQSCDHMAASPQCAAAAAAFNSRFEEHLLQCMLSATDEAVEAMQADGARFESSVQLLTSCAVESEAEGAQEGSLHVPQDLAAAIKWDGSCDRFKSFAMQVTSACSGVRCCADVMENDQCAYYANGLYSLFPNEAFNGCIDQVDIPCTCLLRKATACALQGEVHEILYREKWEPDCVDTIMPHQLTPGEGEESGGIGCMFLMTMMGMAGFLLVFAAAYSLFGWMKQLTMRQQSGPRPVVVETQQAPPLSTKMAVVHVVQNPDGALCIGQLVADDPQKA